MKRFLILTLTLFCLAACAPAELTTRRMLSETGFSPEASGETVNIALVSVPEKVLRGDTATVSIKGEAGVLYAIAVHYSSGVSKAKGLEPAEADKDGCVTWSWKIGSQTKPGEYKITVTGGGGSVDTYFTVE